MSIHMGMKDYETFQRDIESGKNIVHKFQENFFISKIMEDSMNPMKDFEERNNLNQEESKRSGDRNHSNYNENDDRPQQMS